MSYSNTEFAGTVATSDYSKTNLVAVDFLKDTEKIIYEFESYVSNPTISPDLNYLCYDAYPKVYMVNLKTKAKYELIKEYSSVYRYAFKGDKVCIIYAPNYNQLNAALFQGEKQLWKITMKKSYMDIHGFRFTSADPEVDGMMLIENNYSSFQIYRFDDTNQVDYTLKTIRCITFQYPNVAYVVGTREVWVQDMTNVIKKYYFDANIAGMENDSNVKESGGYGLKMGMVLDYQHHYQIAEITFQSTYQTNMNIYNRKIMKDEIPDSKVKGFYRIRMHNQEKKKIEEAILLHLKSSLVALSLESRQIKHEFKKVVSKANVVPLRDKSAIFFWDDNGSKIEKIKIPLDPSNTKLFQKVYEANEDMRMVKTTFIEGEEYLYIVDEAKHMKILKNEENRLSIYKDYYVDTYFSTYADVKNIKQFSYANGMMYSNSAAYILQEKGKEKEYKFPSLYFSGFSLDYNSTKFPMCSDDFILFLLSPEYTSDYTSQYQSLLLAPPMNSHRIKQRYIDESYSHEFFLHFDDRYIIFQEGSYYESKLKVLHLNGEEVQLVNFQNYYTIKRPTFSQSGEFLVIPMMVQPEHLKHPVESSQPDYYGNKYKPNMPVFRVYKITKGKDYKRPDEVEEVQANNNNVEQKKDQEIIKIELIEQYEFPTLMSEDANAWHEELIYYSANDSNDKQTVHCDNKGNF